jgi:hypothetical protein
MVLKFSSPLEKQTMDKSKTKNAALECHRPRHSDKERYALRAEPSEAEARLNSI